MKPETKQIVTQFLKSGIPEERQHAIAILKWQKEKDQAFAKLDPTRAQYNLDVYCDSFERLSALLKYRGIVSDDEWLRLLGSKWEVSDGVWRYIADIFQKPPISNRPGPIREMMDAPEWERLQTLPETVIVYRGCYRRLNERGVSFSLNEAVAMRFPTLNRYTARGYVPIVIRAEVPRSLITAVKLGRDEDEVIVSDWSKLREVSQREIVV